MQLPAAQNRPMPPRAGRALLAALIYQCLVYSGTRLFTVGWRHWHMTTALDRAAPFLPWTVAVYVAAYFFWAANYMLAVRQGEDRAWRFLAADMLGKTVCLVVFLLLPTATVRPAIPEDAPLGGLLGLIYMLDTPDNLFPSIHCLNSWLCWAGIRDCGSVPAGYRAFSLCMALAVALSTLTTKQHVLADAAAGFALGELCWRAAGRTGLGAWYGRLWRRWNKKASLWRGRGPGEEMDDEQKV